MIASACAHPELPPEPSFYYDFADAALVMIDAADLPEDQEVITVKDFCRCVEAKGVSPDRLLPASRARHAACRHASTPSLPPPRSVRLVLQNFFECIHSARSDSESSDADHKPHGSFAAAMEAADARSMEKFAHVAEKFMHKSVVAAIAPFKEAVMRFALLQADTVREGVRGLWCFRRILFCVRALLMPCIHPGSHRNCRKWRLRHPPQHLVAAAIHHSPRISQRILALDSSSSSSPREATAGEQRSRCFGSVRASLQLPPSIPCPAARHFYSLLIKTFLHFLTRLQWRLRPQLAISLC